MSVDIEDFDTPDKPDFRRANGAPMVMIDGKNVRASRPSNYAKPLDDESALTNWRIDTAAFGVAHDKALQAAYAAAKRDDRQTVKALREKAIQAGRGEEAASIGTAIHAMSERWEDPDDDFTPPEPYLSALKAYSAEMERIGVESTHMEVALVNLEYNTAGTADRIYRLTRQLIAPTGEILPEGTLIIGDLKTSKTLEYSMGGFAAQLSLYAGGQMYDVVDDEFLDTPEINQDWGVIAWIPSNQEQGHCEMIWVDLKAGNYAAWLAHEVKEYRKTWRGAQPIIVGNPGMNAGAVAEALDAEELVGEEWVTEMLGFCKSRMKAIRINEEALTTMTSRWPVDLPPPSKITQTHHVNQLLEHLDNVEAHWGLTWPDNDPRTTQPNTRRTQ